MLLPHHETRIPVSAHQDHTQFQNVSSKMEEEYALYNLLQGTFERPFPLVIQVSFHVEQTTTLATQTEIPMSWNYHHHYPSGDIPSTGLIRSEFSLYNPFFSWS